MPDELDCADEDAGADAAGADEVLDGDEPPPPPHPATARASTTTSPLKNCHLRFDFLIMSGSSVVFRCFTGTPRVAPSNEDAKRNGSFPTPVAAQHPGSYWRPSFAVDYRTHVPS
jgi:hypothetical protein